MAEPLPSARVATPAVEPRWLGATLLLLVAVGVPVALRVLAPAQTAVMRWTFHVVPALALALALVDVTRGGGSPWLVVTEPAGRSDPRRWIYLVFDLLFTAGYLIAFEYFIPNRHVWATVLLELLPLSTLLMATGTLVARRWSWWLVLAGGVTMLVWLVVALFVLGYTASYLAGVYGAFGQGASAGILGIMAVLVQFVGLLPAFQLKWIMTRGGRRAFGLRPLWPAPRSAPAVGAAA